MAERAQLDIAPREVMGKATKRLRKDGVIPANIYGHHEPSQAVQINAILFERFLRTHAATNIIDLKMPDASTQTALIRRVQHGPRSGKIVHVEFFRVGLTERLTVKIPLHFVGEAPGVKVEGGMLLPVLETLEVECQASDIVDTIEVDVSGLAELEASLHAGDIQLPANYTLVTPADEVVVKIETPRAEVAEEAAAETAEAQEAAPAASSEQES